MRRIAQWSVSDHTNFRQVTETFLSQPGLPFADVLSEERIQRIFAEHDDLFGMSTVYSTPVVLWAFLGQVLRDGKEASCQAAVADIIVHQALADRFYCSFMMIALLLGRGVDVCARLHQQRHTDFRRGKRLGKDDHLIEWTRPTKPSWMDDATYASIPEKLVLREVRFKVSEPGRRVKSLTIITTLIDPEAFSVEDIAQLYGFRWNSELDIRAIKQSLNLDHLRCQTPEMIRIEFSTTLLAYNLVRKVICEAAVKHDKLPRRISFTETCATILAGWSTLALGLYDAAAIERLLARIASLEISDRPDRIEPRVLKRRRHRYPLMREPRQVLRERLKSRTPCDTIT